MTGAELAPTDVALPPLPAGLGPAAERFARNTLRKSKQTQRTYLSVYARFTKHLAALTGVADPPPSAMTADAVASYLDALEAQGRSPATVRKERAALNRLTLPAARRRDRPDDRAGDPRRRGGHGQRPREAAPRARRSDVARREGSRRRARARADADRPRVGSRRDA